MAGLNRISQRTSHYPGKTERGIEGRNAYTDLAIEQYGKLYFHQDRLGSTIRMTKENGDTIAWADYDAWGKPLSPKYFDMNAAGIDNAVGFTSYTYDTVLDIYFAQARFYDQNTRRFISVDPIKDGINWYAYCGNNPVVFVDPSGLVITQAEIQMFKDGKMAPMAYSYLMDLTFHQYLADTDEDRAVYEKRENDFREAEYLTTNGAYKYIDDGIAFMPKPIEGAPTKAQHYFRNKLNLNFTWEQYQKLQERLPDDMKWIENVAATLHQNNKVNGKDNRKYVSFDGHFELMFNDNNVLLTAANNCQDMGTYNYASPTDDAWGHVIKDVLPYGGLWIKWGNVPSQAGALYK